MKYSFATLLTIILIFTGCQSSSKPEKNHSRPLHVEIKDGKTLTPEEQKEKESYLRACKDSIQDEKEKELHCQCSYVVAKNKLKNAHLDLMTARMQKNQQEVDRLKNKYQVSDETEKRQAVSFVMHTAQCIRLLKSVSKKYL